MLRLPAAPQPAVAPLFPWADIIESARQYGDDACSVSPTTMHEAAYDWLLWSMSPSISVDDIVQYVAGLSKYTTTAHFMATTVATNRRVTLYNCRARLQRARAALIDTITSDLVKLLGSNTATLRALDPLLLAELMRYAWSARGFVIGTWLYAISPLAAKDPAWCVSAAHSLTNAQRQILYDAIVKLVQPTLS